MAIIVTVVIMVVPSSIVAVVGFIIRGDRRADRTAQCATNDSTLATAHLVTNCGANRTANAATNSGLERRIIRADRKGKNQRNKR